MRNGHSNSILSESSNASINLFYDSTIFSLQKIGGITIVFSELIERLKKDSRFNISIITNISADKNILFSRTVKGLQTVKDLYIHKFFLSFSPILKKIPPGSIYHSTYNRYSNQKDIIKVITVHDLGYEAKIMRSGLKRSIHLFFKRKAIAMSTAIICVSNSTKNDLYQYYGNIVNKKIVAVIPNGLGDEFLGCSNTSYFGTSNQVLFVGARHAYKNFNSLVQAIAQTRGFNLTICGGGEITADERAYLDKYLKGRYTLKTSLSKSELIDCYSNAYCLVYPSSYEGFGLPIIEAMACGCPVIACNNSSIPEVSGDSAILLSDAYPDAIVEALNELKDYSQRKLYIDKGKLKSQEYSWNHTAAMTADLYIKLKKIHTN